MKKLQLAGLGKIIKHGIIKHGPEILTDFGIAGFLATTVLAIQATPKALKLIEEEKKKRKSDEKLGVVDTVKVAWKPFVPVLITGTASAICVAKGCSVVLKRNAAIAAAYSLSESTLTEYKQKVVETIGEKKEAAIQDEIAKDRIAKNPVSNNVVVTTGKGTTLCYDYPTSRYFRSDIDKIKKAVNELNRRMLTEMYISLNDFYYELGLPSMPIGEDLGWNIDNGFIEPVYSSQLTDDEPCLVISYLYGPRYDFREG